MIWKRIFTGAVCLSVLLLVLQRLIPLTTVQADIAPPPPPEPGSIFPGQATQVRMEAETVLVDITPSVTQGSPYAAVKASFWMRNQGEQAELIDVRFPLNLLYPSYQSDLAECPYPAGGYPQISDFQARVDGQAVTTATLTEQVGNPDLGQPVQEVACWATFPVRFPPGEEVLIEVGYTAEGYYAWDVDSLVEFPYVLVTGAGWAGTIGSAEITIRAPYELNNLNLMSFSPDDAVVSGRELTWRFNDLEPEWNVSATLVTPHLWAKTEKERQAVADNPDDGEAWGRLGKAYKEANSTRRGYRWDDGALELYALSVDAYEHALALLPNDADWHFGYAELLWRNAEYASFGTNEELRDDLVNAVTHLSTALAINPRHTRSLEMLEEISYWWMWDEESDPAVDLSGPSPDFLILTTTPTARPEPLVIPSETPAPTATLTTQPMATPTEMDEPLADVENQPEAEQEASEDQASTNNKGSGQGLCAAASLPLLAAAAVVIRTGKGSKKRSPS